MLVNFKRNCEHLAWDDLKLRAGQGDRDLATACAPEGQEHPSNGPGRLLFRLAAGREPFSSGRFFCWTRCFFDLKPDQKVTPEQLEGAHRGLLEGSAPGAGSAFGDRAVRSGRAARSRRLHPFPGSLLE